MQAEFWEIALELNIALNLLVKNDILYVQFKYFELTLLTRKYVVYDNITIQNKAILLWLMSE